MIIKNLRPNCSDAVRWSMHPLEIQGATKARVYFAGGYAYLQVFVGPKMVYEALAS